MYDVYIVTCVSGVRGHRLRSGTGFRVQGGIQCSACSSKTQAVAATLSLVLKPATVTAAAVVY